MKEFSTVWKDAIGKYKNNTVNTYWHIDRERNYSLSNCEEAAKEFIRICGLQEYPRSYNLTDALKFAKRIPILAKIMIQSMNDFQKEHCSKPKYEGYKDIQIAKNCIKKIVSEANKFYNKIIPWVE